jgi:DNA end-binding protein Ku
VPDIEPDDQEEAVARAFWNGTITFGLVSIPVALYAANRPRGVSLRMVSPDGTPLNRRYFTSRDDRELDSDEIVRGYEVEKDRFVVVDDDELERLAPERTRDIDVRRFVKLEEVDPMYFERAYYLAPAGNSTKGYRLLAKVMEETGRAGIATFVLRAKEYLVAIMAENGILRAETLRFADELRTPGDVGLPEPASPAATDVKRIEKEIARLAEEHLDRKELVDHSRDRLLKLAERKLRAGEDVVKVEKRRDDDEDRGGVIDLMELLKARISVADDEDADDDRGGARPKKPAGGGSGAKKPASTAKRSASGGSGAKKSASTAKKSAAGGSGAKKSAAKKSASAKRSAGGGSRSKKSSDDADLSESSRAELLERAKKLDITGRSSMSKDELVKAIRRSA